MTIDVTLIVDSKVADPEAVAKGQTLNSLEIVDSLSKAKGTWVMFVHDASSLDRHACKNLLLAAEAEHATLAIGGGQGDAEVLSAGQLHVRFPRLKVPGLLWDRHWLQSHALLADELQDGVREIPASALGEIHRAVVIPQRTAKSPIPSVVDGSRAVVRAGPVGRLAGLAFSAARLLPLSDEVLIDIDGTRPVDSALAGLGQLWQAMARPMRMWTVTPTTRNSWRHAWHLGRARWLISNERFISRLPKRAGQMHVLAVFELPLVRSGRDNPDWVLQPTSERRPSWSQVERWDLAVTSSAFATQVLRSSSGYVGPVLEGESVFADAAAADSRTDQREWPGLDPRLPVVLLALRSSDTLIPVEELMQAFSGRLQFVLVTDDGSPIDVGSQDARQAFDELPSWCAAAQLMITDWSGLAMEYAGLRRPIIGFRPDALDVVRRRGTYLDLPSIWPGPCVSTSEELLDALERWLVHGDGSLTEFHAHSAQFALLGSTPSGDAAARILSALDSGR